MGVLFATNEVESLFRPDLSGLDQTASNIGQDTTYARAGINAGSYVHGGFFTGLNEAWLHIKLGTNSTGGEVSGANMAGLSSCTDLLAGLLTRTDIVRLRHVGASDVRLQYWDGAAFQDAALSTTFVDSGQTFDIHCKIDSVNGRFALYENGVLVDEFIGDTDFFGASINYVYVSGWGSTNPRYYTEAILADESTVGWRGGGNPGTAAGAVFEWDGAFTDVNEGGSGALTLTRETAVIETAVDGEIALLSFADPSFLITDIMDPVAVCVGYQGSTNPSVIQKIQVGLRIIDPNDSNSAADGVDYWSDPDSLSRQILLNEVLNTGHYKVWNTNPATGLPWEPAEVLGSALQYGVKAVA